MPSMCLPHFGASKWPRAYHVLDPEAIATHIWIASHLRRPCNCCPSSMAVCAAETAALQQSASAYALAAAMAADMASRCAIVSGRPALLI